MCVLQVGDTPDDILAAVKAGSKGIGVLTPKVSQPTINGVMQSCHIACLPAVWFGLGFGLGWAGLGWVGMGWVGLGWIGVLGWATLCFWFVWDGVGLV